MFKFNKILRDGKNSNMNENYDNELDCGHHGNSNPTLWNPKYFLLVSILFSFFPAAMLYSINYKRLGRKSESRKVIILAIAGMIIFIVLINIIPGTIAKIAATSINTAVGVTMTKGQASIFEEHIQSGGRAASYLKPIIICAIITAGVISLIIFNSNIPETRVQYNEDEIYYTANILEKDAEKLGQYFVVTRVFEADGLASSVKLDRERNATYIVSFIVDKQNINNEELLQEMTAFAGYISRDVFSNSKVQINLCNSRFKILKVVNP